MANVAFEPTWLSLLPPLCAITLAIVTRQVLWSLLCGIVVGAVILQHGDLSLSILHTLGVLMGVIQQPAQANVVQFTLWMGCLLILISYSGGIDGFVAWMQRKAYGQTKRSAQVLAWLTGVIIHIETSIICLVVGTVSRPLFDKLRISREKLAYICDSVSAPVCMLIPFNAWGATVLGLLAVQASIGNLADETPLMLFIHTMPVNFYPIISVLLVFCVCWFDWNIGSMRKAEHRTFHLGEVADSRRSVQLAAQQIHIPAKADISAQARMMFVPLMVMMLMVFAGLLYTGWVGVAVAALPNPGVIAYLQKASGSTAVLWAVIIAWLVLVWMMLRSKQFSLREMITLSLQGARGMLSMALIMLFAFAIGTICYELNTGPWLAHTLAPHLSASVIVPFVFVVSCVIAFATGTSFGTFAIMIPLAVPLAASFNTGQGVEVSLPLVVSAVLGGGVFGDHCSPISDTVVLSSLASSCDHIDHVNTQLPYALLAAGLSLILYFIVA